MKLEPADYWKLRALDADMAVAQQRLQQLAERRQGFWVELVQRYELDPQRNYRADDATTALEEST